MEINKSEDVVLITGGRGFLGKRLYQLLNYSGYEKVVAMGGTKDGVDLGEEAVVGWMFDNYNPDVVIHLAARVGGIGANMKYPGGFLYENLNMGVKVIEEARQHGCKKFILAGTVCSYPKNCPVPFKEDDLWNGYPEETNAPYGIAKKTLMEMLLAYRKQFGFNGVSLIPVNMYGPGDNHDPRASHVIPAIISRVGYAKANGEKSMEVWGSGNASREFLYVDDCAEAVMLAMERYNEADPVNIGTGVETNIRDLIELICELMEYDGEIVWNDEKPDGQPRRCLDVARAQEGFGFNASTSLREGLERTLEWCGNAEFFLKQVNELPPTERA